MREDKMKDMLRNIYLESQTKAILDDLIISKDLNLNEVLNVLANAIKVLLAYVTAIDDVEAHRILQKMIEQIETGVKDLKEGMKK